MFWVAEQFHGRDGFHLHSLLTCPYRADAIWNYWFHRYGRARILLYDPAIGGSGYVAKYVTKRIADYDLIQGSLRSDQLIFRGKRR